ncbi:hypothetical protein B0H11DRAFT_1900211 [Mycena galericulata]|nr:hypothetical protein B0H11DRAFT_1900211 [Mycena galericulata]
MSAENEGKRGQHAQSWSIQSGAHLGTSESAESGNISRRDVYVVAAEGDWITHARGKPEVTHPAKLARVTPEVTHPQNWPRIGSEDNGRYAASLPEKKRTSEMHIFPSTMTCMPFKRPRRNILVLRVED